MYEGISIRFAVTYGEQKGPVSEIDRGTPEAPIIQSQIWRSGDSWRFNREPPAEGMKYDDAVWADGLAWRLNNQNLVIDNQKGIESSRFRIDLVGNDVDFEWSRISSCLLAKLLHNQSPECAPRLSADNQWTIECELPAMGKLQRGIRARGTWRQIDGWGTIDSVAITVSDDGHEVGREEIIAMDWMPLGGKSFASPRHIVHRMPLDGENIVQVVHVLSFVEFSQSEFESLVRVPQTKGRDAIRGEHVFGQIEDLRGDDSSVLLVDANRKTIPLNPLDRPRSLFTLRQLGWALLVSMVALLITIRLRRTSNQ